MTRLPAWYPASAAIEQRTVRCPCRLKLLKRVPHHVAQTQQELDKSGIIHGSHLVISQ
jgi:hypothetical protein